MKEKVKRILTVNFGYKVLSVFIAFFLWFYVIGEKVAERSYRLAVVFQNVSSGLSVVPGIPRVHITLKGPRSLVMNYNPEDFFIFKDLKNYTPGKYSLPVTVEDIPIQEKEIELVDIEPSELDIEIKVKGDKIVRFKDVPVKILESTSNFFRVTLDINEVYVELMKTEEYVSKLDINDIVIFLDVSELKEGIYQLPLQAKVPPGIKLVKIEPNIVKATLESYRF